MEAHLKAMILALDEPVPPWDVDDRDGLSYIAHEAQITKANEIFGEWDYETDTNKVILEETYRKNDKDMWRVQAKALVDTRTPLGRRSGTGAAIAFNPSLWDAREQALKSAETDALKRSLYNYGWALGLCLFNKTYLAALKSGKWRLFSPQYIEKCIAAGKPKTLDPLQTLDMSRYRKYVLPRLEPQPLNVNGEFEKQQAQGA